MLMNRMYSIGYYELNLYNQKVAAKLGWQRTAQALKSDAWVNSWPQHLFAEQVITHSRSSIAFSVK